MKTSGKKLVTQSIALSGEALSEDQLKEAIKAAEKGPFYSIEESKKLIKGWREQKHLK
ncbi:MAG: hypothetical protein ING84_12065 [Cytophagales bacterium]|jgi:hypothetical protein|nr:hypothetical protein [Cytophagales bacterium]MCA6369295.1 hypothetical protein [Cytophagales bacterium]MCA6373588.1 hypothetical protein [Cytophagales bacterium]MCA6377136.1 hypothetical protein [Cytophagales bacterium]MCA6384942.1 hypothetical protein [Cytophagales bacterium]